MIQPSSFIELNVKALQTNIDFISKLAGPDREVLHVVKGNAYGHGIEQFVPILQRLGVGSFGVFDAFEAYRVSKVSINMPKIVIMGMIDKHEIEWAIQHDIEIYIFDFSRLLAAIELSNSCQRKAKVHIEVETGMNRTGFEWRDRKKLSDMLTSAPYLELKGLCTHYAGAENFSNLERVHKQLLQFKKWKRFFLNQQLEFESIHGACSAAAIRLPETRMQMIRTGILQYGFWPSQETFIDFLNKKNRKTDPLKRVLSWKSTVMSVKHVLSGSYIGYGTSFLASHNMTVVSVPVGYAHGFARSLSNHGRVLIRGVRLPVIGTVNMNMLLVDATQLSSPAAGEEVVLIGTQLDQSISVASFSEYSNQLNYELLTRLPSDLPRVISV